MTLSIQDHIHIATTLTSGPEYAPFYKWHTTDRSLSTVTMASIKRGLTGHLHTHVLTSGGVPIIFTPINFVVKVGTNGDVDGAESDAYILRSFLDKSVYFVDNKHVADGVDHTPYVKTMVVSTVGDLKLFNPDLSIYFINITLEDNFSA